MMMIVYIPPDERDSSPHHTRQDSTGIAPPDEMMMISLPLRNT